MSAKGFTLIELLIVIAIIGILASIVLASLGQARAKASDATIKSDLKALLAEDQYFYDLNASFPIFNLPVESCTQTQSQANTAASGNPAVLAFIAQVSSIIAAAGNASNGGGTDTATCNAVAGPWPAHWAVSVPLRSDSTKSWCIDSTGISKQITGTITSAHCP